MAKKLSMFSSVLSGVAIIWGFGMYPALAAESFRPTPPASREDASPPNAGTITLMLPGNVPMELIRIPAGSFLMGAYLDERSAQSQEYPQHAITLTRDYFIGKYEVTQEQWEALMGSNPSHDYGVGPTHPVYFVSRPEAAERVDETSFLLALDHWLAESGQLGEGQYRLPTEAEWEYACRAGTDTRFSFGDALDCGDIGAEFCDLFDQNMWWWGNQSTDSRCEAVGGKLPNPWGLYDMHGNVWEFVADGYDSFFYLNSPTEDPFSPFTGITLARGGSWYSDAQYCRSATRNISLGSGTGYRNVGFRLAATADPTVCALSCDASAIHYSPDLSPIEFQGSWAFAPPGCGIASYEWAFGDGSTSAGESVVSHTYQHPGTFLWTFTVSVNGQTCAKSGTLFIGVPGDCNGDGSVSIGEVQKAINMFLGIEPVGCGVDCSGDGSVSIGEVQKVINIFLGLATGC